MRFSVLAAACALATSSGFTGAQAPAASPLLTYVQALRLAESGSPVVKLREAQLAAAEGVRQQASTLLANNPELSIERRSKSTRQSSQPDENSSGWAFGLTQTIETGGQQARRRDAAAALLDALRAEIEEARRLARSEAALRFYAVLAAQRRIQIEQKSLDLFDLSAQTVAKRRAAGEDTRLDANVAVVEAERARNAVAIARQRWLDARGELASALQLPPSELPDVAAESATAPASGSWTNATVPYKLAQLLDAAHGLPRLKALVAREDAARARLSVERASRSPDVTFGITLGREGPDSARDHVAALTLSVPLPLFKRNEAGIGQALTDMSTAEIERASVLRDQEAQIRRLWSRLGSQRDRIARLQSTLLPASTDNQQLSIKSRQAGQIGLLDQLLINRQTLDAERDLNDAFADYHATRIELENAADWSLEGASR